MIKNGILIILMEKLDPFYPLDKVVVSAEQSERASPLQVWAVPECERALGRKEEALSAPGEPTGARMIRVISSVLMILARSLLARSCLYPGSHLNIKISTYLSDLMSSCLCSLIIFHMLVFISLILTFIL